MYRTLSDRQRPKNRQTPVSCTLGKIRRFNHRFDRRKGSSLRVIVSVTVIMSVIVRLLDWL